MTKPELVATRLVAISDIEIINRLRPVSEAHVAALMVSIEEIGLQTEVQLRQLPEPKPDMPPLRLMAGGHRVAAFLRLGFDEIPAKIIKCNADQARMIEIDDNLAHADLDPLDLALSLAERKRIFERLHPESKRGIAGAVARWDATELGSVASFVTSSAQTLGMSERQIRKLVVAGNGLQGDMVALLRRAPRKVTLKDLQHIAKLTQGYQRMDVCRALAEGKARTAQDAIRKADDSTVGNTRDEADLERLIDCFDRASKAVRRRFVTQRLGLLQDLMPSADTTDEDGDTETVVPFVARHRE